MKVSVVMSAGYAVITVQTAWLKFYYPLDFMCATINSVITKSDKLKFYISDAQNMGITVLGPDVNKSEELYSIEGDCIRTGLMGLRNLGKMAKPIISERNKGGLFTSIEDFINRLISEMDKRMLESLIYAGGLDCFSGTRKSKIDAIPDILEFIKSVKKGIFEDIWFNLDVVDKVYTKANEIKFEDCDEFERGFLFEKEYEYAGMFISGHPLDLYSEVLKAKKFVEILDILPEETTEDDTEYKESAYNEQTVQVAGIIRDLKQIITKKGDKMYMCSLEDKTATIKCVLFPKIVSYCEELLEEKKLVTFSGRVDDNEKGCQIIVGNVKDINDMKLSEIKEVWIDGRKGIDFNLLKDFIEDNEGTTKVKVQKTNGACVYGKGIDLNWTTLMKLKEHFNVILK